jgi:hypothetical protein
MKILKQKHEAYSELALHRLKAGKIVPGYSAEKDLTNRQWKDGVTVELAPLLFGKDISKKQLVTPPQAIAMGVPEDAVNALTERREKGVKLARMDADKAVKKMFKGMI